MLSFNVKAEQAFDPKRYVERVLGACDEGDVALACWEPGQTSPYHCHPHATEIYFCVEGGGMMRPRQRRSRSCRDRLSSIRPANCTNT